MATSVDYLEDSRECGYCLQQNDQLVDPRRLPCTHVYCYPCLVENFQTNKIVQCGKCRLVFDVTLAGLPSATTRADNILFCDMCTARDATNFPAVSYCTSCNNKLCTKDVQLHNEVHPEHKDIMNIQQYKQNMKKFEIRTCTKHIDEPLTLGCTICHGPLCFSCLDTFDCIDGREHQLVTLEQLVKLLTNRKNEVKVAAYIKEENLYGILKFSTKVLSDYDIQTGEMVDQVHTTRDEQNQQDRRRYNVLEEMLVENRKKSKEQVIKFIERLGTRLTEINNLLLLQDARFRDAHQVDIVGSFADKDYEIQRLVDEELPSFTLTDQWRLRVQAADMYMKLRLVKDVDIHIDERRSKGKFPLPTSLMLKEKVTELRHCRAVFSHKGVTYVSHGQRVSKIDESNFSRSPFILRHGTTCSLSVGTHRLFALGHPPLQPENLKVDAYNLRGTIITSWEHAKGGVYFNKLAVTADKVVAPDGVNKRLTVYTLDGQLIKHIPCPYDGGWNDILICSPDNESVVVAIVGTSKVCRVHLATEEVMWTSTQVANPGGITCYGEDYILIATLYSTKTEISILDTHTGKFLGKLQTSSQRKADFIVDLHVSGNTLVVIKDGDQTVQYYELKSD